MEYTTYLEILRDIHTLHRTLVSDDLVSNASRPEAPRSEVSQQVLVHDGELSGQHPPVVHVAGFQFTGGGGRWEGGRN